MTALGKILVFVNLVFSLLTGGLIVMVFMTRTNWADAYRKLDARSKIIQADYSADIQEQAKKIQDSDAAAQKVAREKEDLAKQLTAAKEATEQVRRQLTDLTTVKDQQSEQNKTWTEELNRRKAEVAQLQGQITERDKRVVDLESQLTKTRADSVSNKLALESLKERFANLLAQYEVAAKDLAQLKARGISAPTGIEKVAPPQSVRGSVKQVDGNLATISVGTDSGVNKDNVLQVFRLSPTPEWLGKIVILSATPFEAVGRFEPRSQRSIIRVGDEVADKVLAGGK